MSKIAPAALFAVAIVALVVLLLPDDPGDSAAPPGQIESSRGGSEYAQALAPEISRDTGPDANQGYVISECSDSAVPEIALSLFGTQTETIHLEAKDYGIVSALPVGDWEVSVEEAGDDWVVRPQSITVVAGEIQILTVLRQTSLRVIAIDSVGDGIPGVRWRWSSNAVWGESRFIASGTSGVDGIVDVLVPAVPGELGLVAAGRKETQLSLPGGGTPGELQVHLEDSSNVVVLVLDALSGLPVTSGSISVREGLAFQASISESGRAIVRPRSVPTLLHVDVAGYVPATAYLQDDGVTTVKVWPGSDLAVSVIDTAGNPIGDATCSLLLESESGFSFEVGSLGFTTCVTDDFGAVVFSGLPRGVYVEAIATHPLKGTGSTRVELGVAESVTVVVDGSEILNIVLTGSSTVDYRSQVEVFAHPGSRDPVAVAWTGDSTVSIPAPESVREIRVSRGAWFSRLQRTAADVAAGGAVSLEIPDLVSGALHVRNMSGASVLGGALRLERVETQFDSAFNIWPELGGRIATSHAGWALAMPVNNAVEFPISRQGTVEYSALPAGEYRVSMGSPPGLPLGAAWIRSRVIWIPAPDGQDVVVDVPELVELLIVDAKTNEPVSSGIVLSKWQNSDNAASAAFSRGLFQFWMPSGQSDRLLVSAAGYQATGKIDWEGDGDRRSRKGVVSLELAKTIRLRCHSADGVGLGNVVISGFMSGEAESGLGQFAISLEDARLHSDGTVELLLPFSVGVMKLGAENAESGEYLRVQPEEIEVSGQESIELEVSRYAD